MESVIAQIVVGVALSILGGVIGWLFSQLKAAMAERAAAEARQRAMEDGVRVFLRSHLRMMHERYVADGKPCSVETKEEATLVYDAYHALGGNGTGTHLYNEIMEAHVKE